MERVEARPGTPFKNSHLSGRNEVCPPLEKVILSNEGIGIRLANRYLAIRILERAFGIAKALKSFDKDIYDGNKTNKLLSIAAVQAEIGEDPIPTIKIATGLITDDDTDVLARAWASRIVAYAGDEKLALELAEKASEHTGGTGQWPLRYAANVLRERGRNPKLFLDKAAELADTDKTGGERVSNFAALARTMYEHGRDPKPWLEKAHQALQQTDEKYWTYNSLANTYAAMGEYATAKSLVNSIVTKPDETAFAKRVTLSNIAHRQAKNGDIDDAVKTAYESGFSDSIAIILMRKAYLQAKNGEDPSETLTQALSMAEHEESGLNINTVKINTTIAYSTAGRILAIAGKNPDDMFKIASQRIDKLNKQENKSDAYKHLAMDIFASGKDSHLVLDAALSEESRLSNPLMLNDILDAAIACGYNEYFNIIMDRLESYKINNKSEKNKMRKMSMKTEIDSWKIDFLTKIAKFQGENSLTREGIAKLSNEEIQEIEKSEFPVVKSALTYFRKIQS